MKMIWFAFLMSANVIGFGQSIEQFLSQPIESNLVASPNGKKVVWVINDKGVRNILLRVESDPPKQLTNFQKDDGQEISQISFSSNSTKITFVKGGFVFIKDLSSAFSSLKISEGSNPLFYPDGLKLAFVKQGQLFESTLDIKPDIKQLSEISGINFLRLSPTENEILFTGYHGKQINAGIFSLTDSKVKWIKPENATDLFPCWSPDGKQIAFMRRQDTVEGVMVCVADAATLEIKTVWGAKVKSDDFFYQNISRPICWTTSNRILFYSEHTGWRHIFSIKADGSDLKDLTPGECETDNYTLDAYAQNIYYSSNKEDVERRHIWKSAVTGESTSQITKGAGIETDPIAVGANLYCFRTSLSSTSLLTRVDEFRKTNTPVNSFKPLPANYFVKPEAVAVPTSEGTSLGGQLFIDRLLNGKRIPLVFIHGGPQQQMMSGFHSNDTYSDVYAFNQYLASLGYAVIAINYRGSSGYGKDFRSSTKFDSKKELLDIVAAAKFLQLLPEVDKTKVGVFGLGYGGNLAEQMLANYSDLFKGGVNIQINDGSGSEDRVRAADIGKWSSPVLFIGSQDQLASKIELTTKLKNKNVSVDIFQLPSETPLNSRESRVIVFKNIQDFFDKKLK